MLTFTTWRFKGHVSMLEGMLVERISYGIEMARAGRLSAWERVVPTLPDDQIAASGNNQCSGEFDVGP